MKTLSLIRQSSSAIFVVLLLVFGAIAQTTEFQTKNAENPAVGGDSKTKIGKNTEKTALDKKAFLSQFTEEQLKEIQDARDEVMASPAACTPTTPIAFSTSGTGHRGSGGYTVIYYNKQSDKIITNENGGAAVSWLKPATYVVPCSGLYVLTLSFQKDAYYPPATADDVTMYFSRNLDPGDPISHGYGWAGEGSPRGTGTYTVAYRLNQGDFINTWSGSDGGFPRHLIVYYYSIFRIAP